MATRSPKGRAKKTQKKKTRARVKPVPPSIKRAADRAATVLNHEPPTAPPIDDIIVPHDSNVVGFPMGDMPYAPQTRPKTFFLGEPERRPWYKRFANWIRSL
jgi:hypothetical protein